MEIKLLSKENLDRTLEENGRLALSGRTVWKEYNMRLDDQEHIIALLELYELRDMGKVEIDNHDNPEYCVCASGKADEDMEAYVFCIFSSYVNISRKVRRLE